ncbi:MAG: glutamate 5-kinase [Oscillospiraceae bacterium]|nr:glutamate 5-kinase [Oscillospiraceae bacterium]
MNAKHTDTPEKTRVHQRIVIKVGTSTLAYPTGLLNIRGIESLVKVTADLQNSGKEMILVSSGAVGIGRGKLGITLDGNDIPTRQACAAVGQGELIHVYDKLFSAHNHNIAQVLLTRGVIEDKRRKCKITDALARLLALRCIPIINENDVVATEELEFGDNDEISAMAAVFLKADLLIILTDRDGFYTSAPQNDPNAKLIPKITEITGEIRSMAGESPGALGRGGMVTKLAAAEYAGKHGIPTVILNGAKPELIYDLIDGKDVGTIFNLEGEK